MPNQKGEQVPIAFTKNTIEQINIYRESPKNESMTDGAQVKLTPTQKAAIQSICKEHNLSASTLLREALDFYIDLFPYRLKLQKYHRDIRRFLQIIKS